MKIYFKTFGCKVNQYETEVIREQLHKAGCVSVDVLADADWCIINSCTVTKETDHKCRYMINRIQRENPRCQVVFTGCSTERKSQAWKTLFPNITVISQQEKNSVVELITRQKASPDYILNSFYHHTRAFVKIQDGCDAHCSYCIVPHVRPHLYSRNDASVIQEVKNLIAAGFKEIVLTGIRLGRYVYRENTLAQLVQRIIELDGDFRVRLSSLEINEIDEHLLKVFCSSEKLCRHMHIPLQSGDNDILKHMNRPYTIESFTDTINRVRHVLPHIGITTDILVGYPNETELQFENTFNAVNWIGFSRLHVFRFSPRPGTLAVLEKNTVSAREVSMRLSIMKLISAMLKNRFAEQYVGKECRVLAEQEKRGSIGGFTDNYIRVLLPQGTTPGVFVKGILKQETNIGFTIS